MVLKRVNFINRNSELGIQRFSGQCGIQNMQNVFTYLEFKDGSSEDDNLVTAFQLTEEESSEKHSKRKTFGISLYKKKFYKCLT